MQKLKHKTSIYFAMLGCIILSSHCSKADPPVLDPELSKANELLDQIREYCRTGKGPLEPGETKYDTMRSAITVASYGPKVVPLLAERLEKEDLTDAKAEYLIILGQMYCMGRASLPALIRTARQDKDDMNRQLAVGTIGRACPMDESAQKALAEVLHDKNSSVRRMAGETIWLEVDRPVAPELLESLAKALGDEDPWVRVNCAAALAQLGVAKKALPVLISSLKDKGNGLRVRAAAGLGAAGPSAKEALPLLENAQKDAYGPLRIASAVACARIGRVSNEALPMLMALVNDKEPRMRDAAILALGVCWTSSEETYKAVTELFNNDRLLTKSCAETLGVWSKTRKDARGFLEQALTHKDTAKRVYAAIGLARNGYRREEAVAILVAGMEENPEEVWAITCAESLGELGSFARTALPALEAKASNSRAPYVRIAAGISLCKISTS